MWGAKVNLYSLRMPTVTATQNRETRIYCHGRLQMLMSLTHIPRKKARVPDVTGGHEQLNDRR
jgi:hypothetical protein